MPPLTRRRLLSLDLTEHDNGDDHWIRVHRMAMACRFEVLLHSSDAADVAAARSALDEADAIESVLTVFDDGSEVSQVNRRAASEPVRIRRALYGLIERSVALHAATGGAFDVTSTALSRCWGFLHREGRVPGADDIGEALARVGSSHLELDPAAVAIRFRRPGIELNFGAIGKGYALDRMAYVLRRHGARRALLSAGGSSVLAVGGRGRGWPIDVRPALAGRWVGRLWIRDGAVGTSGAGEQFVEIEGRRYGHVIDPRTGQPSAGVLGATVVTADAASADALSTAFLIGGPALAAAYCSAHPNTLAVLVLDDPDQAVRVCGRFTGAILEQ